MWLSKKDMLAKVIREIESLGGQKAFADKYGFSAQYVSDICNGRRGVSPALAFKLGYEYREVYKRVGR